MDPVSVFNALHDTKCLKFGQFQLKSGLRAPYYMNLRRLPLYPKLMDAIVTQVVEKFLTSQALVATTSQLRRQLSARRTQLGQLGSELERKTRLGLAPADSDADSQLGEDELETGSEDDDWEKIRHHLDPILCGVPYGALPLAVAVAYKAQLPYLFERKHAKSYGDPQPLLQDFNDQTRAVLSEPNQAKGNPLERRQSVILIEDVICSGASVLETVRNLERLNLRVEFVICIVDREENGVSLLLEEAGIRVLPLYNMSAILRVLETTGRITSKTFIETRQWMANNQFQSIGVDPTPKFGGDGLVLAEQTATRLDDGAKDYESSALLAAT